MKIIKQEGWFKAWSQALRWRTVCSLSTISMLMAGKVGTLQFNKYLFCGMKIIFTIYFLMVHIFMGILFAKPDILPRIQAKLGFEASEAASDELTSDYYMMVAFHRRVDENVPENSVIFVGDSLIQGLAVSAVTPLSINYGIGQDTSAGVLKRIPDYFSILRSKAVVIAIGFNDLKRRDNDEILKNYKKIIDLIPINIPILFSAVLPVDEVASKRAGFNDRILKLNIGLSVICANSPRLYFLDIAPQITDSNGNLLRKYNIGDGIHLNGLGNRIWISNLKDLILKMAPNKQQEQSE